ncbi:MAG: hypothetical protein PHF50_01550 [Patescibacteria group bacterium]|nr:hypothetical protein [Patescibacteria group bacterium]
MINQEIEIKDNSILPKFLYHLVPRKLFVEFSDINGNYDCRNKKEWGNNSPFIHTTLSRQQLKERVADTNWADYSLKEKFLLLEIDTRMLKTRITYSIINDYIYHHIWGRLSKKSFKVFEVKRSKDGKFLI